MKKRTRRRTESTATMTDADKFDCLVAELVDEVLATGLSVADAETRLINEAVRDLQVNDLDLYWKACQDAAPRDLSVAGFLAVTHVDARIRVQQRAQYELNQLRWS